MLSPARLAALFFLMSTASPPWTAASPQDSLPSAPTSPAAPSAITWHGRVERIVQEKCQRCHHPGGPGPFALMELDDFEGNEARIRQAVTDRVMPPWFATESSGPFRDDLSLDDEQRRDLLAWLDQGTPAGDPKDAPPPRTWPTGWQIGEPDLVITVPDPISIPATGIVNYVNIDVPFPLDHDVWVQAIQVLCEHPEICHHAQIDALYPASRTMELVDAYLPGKGPTTWPDGMAFKIERGALIRFNMHYTPNGRAVKERTSLGLRFAKEPPRERVNAKILKIDKIKLMPGEADVTMSAERKITFDAELRRLMPHMHLRGKSIRIDVVHPDGTQVTPLEIERWHPDWQFGYDLVEPIKLTKGTVVRCTCTWDNSDANPFNPDPRKVVRTGPQTWDEMGGCFLEWTRPAAIDQEPRDPDDAARGE